VAEGARLESVYTLTGIGGSNPSLSARFHAPPFYPSRAFHATWVRRQTALLKALFLSKIAVA
jgi:hypothetical protein